VNLTRNHTYRFYADTVILDLNSQLVNVKTMHNHDLPTGSLRVSETRKVWHRCISMRVNGNRLTLTGHGRVQQPTTHGGLGATYTYSKAVLETVIGAPRRHEVLIEYGGKKGIKVTQLAR
jgi:hypothetical protein